MGEYINDIAIYDEMKKWYCNDDLYCNCYFMSLLNITRTFGKNENEIILNADLTYDLFEKNDSGYPGFRLKVDTFDEIQEVLKRMGIGYTSDKIEVTDVIHNVEKYLKQGNLILLSIDLYYQKNKVYYYQTKHGEHSVLVYGYNDEKQCLYIVDNINKGYQKYAISYEEVGDYMKGLCDYYGYDKCSYYYTRFFKEGEKKKQSDTVITDKFLANINKNKAAYKMSLQSILEFRIRLSEICTYPSFEENLLTLKYRKASICFRNRLVLELRFRNSENYETLINNQDEVYRLWTQFRTYYIYAKRKNTPEETICMVLSDILLKIHQKETCFYDDFLRLAEGEKKVPIDFLEKEFIL